MGDHITETGSVFTDRRYVCVILFNVVALWPGCVVKYSRRKPTSHISGFIMISFAIYILIGEELLFKSKTEINCERRKTIFSWLQIMMKEFYATGPQKER